MVPKVEIVFCRLTESREYMNNRPQNRRFQTSVIDSDDFSDEDEDEADLLLPPGKSRENTTIGNGNARKPWQEHDGSLHAETSPDSLASTSGSGSRTSGPEVKYEGFTEFNYNNKSQNNVT